MDTKSADRKYILALLLCAVAIHIPAFYFPFAGHSVLDNGIWSKQFAETLFSGHLYPRWLTQVYAGCGSPVFFFYFPVPYYASSLFQWLPGDVQSPIICVFIIVHALSGLAFYGWVKTWCPAREAALSSALYLMMPYCWIDMYSRNAYTEFFSFLFLPLLLHLTQKIIDGDIKAIFLFAGIYALQIMSSMHMTLIGSLLIMAYSLHLIHRQKAYLSITLMAAPVLLGVLLASIYLLPMMEGYSHIRLSTTDETYTGVFGYREHFIISSDRFDNHLFLSLIISVYLVFSSKKPARFMRRVLFRNATQTFWMVAIGVSLLLMTRISSFTLVILPFLKMLQFPWRFAIITTIAVPAAASYILALKKEYPIAIRRFELGLYANCAVFGVIALIVVAVSPIREATYINYAKFNIEAWANEYLPSKASMQWLWPGKDKGEDANTACETQKVWGGTGEAKLMDVEEWESRNLRFTVDVAKPGTVVVGQFNFPYWQAQDENGTPVRITTSPEGLISLSLPRGSHHIRVQMAEWKSEYYGKWLSLAGLLITAGGYFIAWLLGRRRKGL